MPSQTCKVWKVYVSGFEVGDLVVWGAISGSLGMVVEKKPYNFYRVCWFTGSELKGRASILTGGAMEKLEGPIE